LFAAIGIDKMIPLSNDFNEAINDIEKGKQR